jgi:PAS domain S-box-containing protein
VSPHQLIEERGVAALQLVFGGAALALLTWMCIRFQLTLATTAFVYLIAIVLLSLWVGFISSVVLSLIAVALLNFFFAMPGFDIRALLPEDITLVTAFFLTSLVVTRLIGSARQSEADLRAHASLLDLTHDTIFVRDMNDVITYWNRGAELLYGWNRAEAVGQVSHQRMRTVSPTRRDDIDAELLRTGRWEGEVVYTRADGTQVVVASRRSLQRDDQGRPVAILETNNDITERKRATEALRESEAQWKDVFEHNPVMYFMVDATGTVLSVNAFGANQLGYPVSELVGQSTLNVFLEEDRESVRKHLALCLQNPGQPRSWEIRKVRKDGSVLWVRENATAVRRAGNHIVLIACEDITERRRTQDALRRSEAYLAEAQRLSRTGSLGWNISSGEIFWSDETFRIFGYDKSAPATLDMITQRTHPDDLAVMQQSIESVSQGGKGFDLEHRLLMPDGSIKHVHVVAHPVRVASGGVEFVGALMDVTDQHQARTALEQAFDAIKKSEDHLRLVIDTIPSMVWSCGPDGSIDFVSQSLVEYYGLSLEDGGRLGLDSVFHPDDSKRAEERSTIFAAEKPFELEFRARRADGEYRWFLSRAVPLRDGLGNVVRWYGAITDIHERKRAEDALRESEQRFRDYAETASDWLWETGPDHRVTRVSKQFAVMGNIPALGVGLTRWDFADDLDEEPEKWRLHIATLEAHRPFRGFVFRVVAGDGSVHYIATSGKPVFDPEGHFLGYRGVGSDVTATVRAEQMEEALHKTQMELAHVTRVTTLGELTASIAHEVNQPLAAIVTYGEAGLHWLDREVPDLGEVREALGDMINNGRRAGEIIQRLRALSRRTETHKVALDINDAIDEVVPLVQQEVLNHRVSLRLELTPRLPAVLGDRVQLQQVIINLVVNGMEAMASVTDRPHELVVRSQLDDGGQVLVAVEDSGVGIDPANVQQLFNAFLTTKPDGMGMGLSICRSIIENHGGHLWASPNTGPGATFQFALRSQEVRS